MDELVGCSVCLMPTVYLPTVYYYSWENCTIYISFSCIVTTKTKNWFSVIGVGILASDNQNIYWKWSSIRHKQVINNINRSQEELWTLFSIYIENRSKSIENIRCRIVCCVHHKMHTNSDLVLQTNNNLVLYTRPGRFSQIIELL